MSERRVRYGVDWEREMEANRILSENRKKTARKHSEKNDYLSPSQLEYRRRREVYNTNGVPEKELFSGIFKRTYNRTQGVKRKLKGQQ